MTRPGKRTLRMSAGSLLCLTALLAGCVNDLHVPSASPSAARSPAAQATPRPTAKATPRREAQIAESPAPGRSVSLVAIGNFPPDLVAQLAAFYWKKYGIDIEILLPSPVDRSAFDPVRKQLIAEDLMAGLARSYPKTESQQGKVIIGLLSGDMYSTGRPEWKYVFGLRDADRYAVISMARMGDLAEPIPPIVTSRLRKMVTRNISVLYYGLPLNDDPSSVLFLDILGPDDLDRMDEELCGLECPVISAGHSMGDVGFLDYVDVVGPSPIPARRDSIATG